MKTYSHNSLHKTVLLTLVLGVIFRCGFLRAAEPAAATPVVPAVMNEVSTTATSVAPVRYEANMISADGIPLAREDVIPKQTAVSASSKSPVDLSQAKISNRATDAKMQGFLARTSLQQLASVYREAAQMIDARHVNPPSYEDRTRGSVEDVIKALNNEHFLQVHGARVSAQAIQGVQNQLMQIVQTQPARDANQAVALMQTTAEVVNRGTGIRREAVALEFLNGTLDSLDQYSAFMPESGNSTPGAMLDVVQTAGLDENVVGLGVEIEGHAQGAEVVGIVDNSPAAQLGLQVGDIITAINQQSMAGRTLNEVADKLAGTAGSSVTLEIMRGGQKFRGSVVRRSFYVSSVTGTKMIDPASGTGYIRLKQFSESSAKDLEKALFTLHNQGMKSLVFDLRGNPGGLLDVCVEISDMFLTKGTIVSTKGRNASDNTQEVATQPKTWSVPLVVLVDDNSASASEIFAAAIQENQRGVIVGRTSYGKGTVQTHFPMKSVPAILKLTTAKFYSPNGREMAGAGVTPDVPVTVAAGTRNSDSDNDVKMAQQVIAYGAPSQMVAAIAGNQTNTNFNLGNMNLNPFNNGVNYGTPSYGTPNYGTPNYGVPSYGTPSYGAPGYSTPNYGVPNYGSPLTSNQPLRQYPAGVREQ